MPLFWFSLLRERHQSLPRDAGRCFFSPVTARGRTSFHPRCSLTVFTLAKSIQSFSLTFLQYFSCILTCPGCCLLGGVGLALYSSSWALPSASSCIELSPKNSNYRYAPSSPTPEVYQLHYSFFAYPFIKEIPWEHRLCPVLFTLVSLALAPTQNPTKTQGLVMGSVVKHLHHSQFFKGMRESRVWYFSWHWQGEWEDFPGLSPSEAWPGNIRCLTESNQHWQVQLVRYF